MILFFVFSLVRIILMTALVNSWRRIPQRTGTVKKEATFSVLIPVRNEESNIARLLEDLENQTYPLDSFEVIVIDDDSVDRTAELVREHIKKGKLNLTLHLLKRDGRTGKKAGIALGVQKAVHEYILTTDGDCRLPSTWIEGYASGYRTTVPPVMIAGPVRMSGQKLFENMQSIEFSSLIGFGAISLQARRAGTCNGANFSYKRAVFFEVNGYGGNEQIPSGDDEFLLIKVTQRYPDRVIFLKDSRSIVTTPAKPDLLQLINQRIRWSSKWKYHKNFYITLSAGWLYFDYLLLILFLILAFFGAIPLIPVVALTAIRWLFEFIYLRSITRFLGVRIRLAAFILVQIIYPIFVTFLGLASIFGKYSWKGRIYS